MTPLALSTRVLPSGRAWVTGFCLKSGVLQPSGISSTSCQMLTPGMEDFLVGFPGEHRRSLDLPPIQSRNQGRLVPPTCFL